MIKKRDCSIVYFLLTIVFVTYCSLTYAQDVPVLPDVWKIKFENWEYFNPAIGPDNLNNDDPAHPDWEDNWGVAQITRVMDTSGGVGVETWGMGDNRETIRMVYGGLDVSEWTADGFETVNSNEVNSFMSFYLHTGGDTNHEVMYVSNGPDDRIGMTGYRTVSDGAGVLLGTFNFVDGINTDGDSVLTMGGVSASNPPTGRGSGYLKPVAGSGPWADQILAAAPKYGDDRYVFMVFDFTADSLTHPADGWHMTSEDPMTGGATSCTGTIGDFVWYDLNRNGIQDAGEHGLDGVTIKLMHNGMVIDTETTDADGHYLFEGLCEGDYTVEVDESTLLTDYVPSDCEQGSDTAKDSNYQPANVELIGDDDSDMTIDFGYNSPCTGTIGDFIWYDLNRDGIQDAGEPGLDGVTVKLMHNGMVIDTEITDADGHYLFEGLCEGDYTVEVDESTLLTDYVPSDCEQGSDTAKDSNYQPANVELIGDDDSDMTIDFGYNSPCTGTIGDFIWYDLNRDGIQDAGEPGLDGVTVKLMHNGMVIDTEITDADGHYLFEGLCKGDYTVEVDESTLLPDYVPSDCEQGADTAKDSNYQPANVELIGDNDSDMTIDFGYYKDFDAEGTGTPGYWKNHSSAWPVDYITIGGITYSKKDAIGWMKTKKKVIKNDKTFTMFAHLVSAKLNVIIGNDSTCIADTIVCADVWMAIYGPVGSGVAADSYAWQGGGEELAMTLDDYNNGLLCAPHRD